MERSATAERGFLLSLCRVKKIHHHLSLLDLLKRLLYPKAFNHICSLPYSRSVYKPEANSSNRKLILYSVTGGSCDIRNNGALFIKQSIKKRRFSNIGFTNYRYRNTVFNDVSCGKGIYKSFEHLRNTSD